MRALLDVNVLVALLDGGHLHHRAATAWLARNDKQGWASCPITENGCIRVMSLPAYPNAQPASAVASRLAAATRQKSHAFWADSVSLLDDARILWDRVLGSRQLTDVYLLALAVAENGRLVTFDRSIPLSAVPGAQSKHLVALPPQER